MQWKKKSTTRTITCLISSKSKKRLRPQKVQNLSVLTSRWSPSASPSILSMFLITATFCCAVNGCVIWFGVGPAWKRDHIYGKSLSWAEQTWPKRFMLYLTMLLYKNLKICSCTSCWVQQINSITKNLILKKFAIVKGYMSVSSTIMVPLKDGQDNIDRGSYFWYSMTQPHLKTENSNPQKSKFLTAYMYM